MQIPQLSRIALSLASFHSSLHPIDSIDSLLDLHMYVPLQITIIALVQISPLLWHAALLRSNFPFNYAIIPCDVCLNVCVGVIPIAFVFSIDSPDDDSYWGCNAR